MIATPPINRELLGPSGFDLSEDDYVRVVAALGAKSTFAPAASGAGQQSLRWSMGQFLDQRALPRISLDVSKIWPVWKDATDQQILIDADHIPLGSPDLIDVVRVLSHSAVGLASIAVDLFSPHAGDKWQWPLRVAALPDDFADLGVETLGGKWPSSSLAEVHELSREHIRAEVLLIRADLRDALQRILALPYPVRAGYCILLMPVDVKWDDVRSYLAALLAETQAGGASFVALPASQSVADILNKWIEELSHNLPFDRSLGAAFKVAPSIHILNSALIDRAALPTAATRLAPRLRQLPPDIKFTLPADISQARINWTAGRPLSVLADELESKAAQISYSHESEGATAISQISGAERDARRAAAGSEPPRFLQGEVFRLSQGRAVGDISNLAVGQSYRFEIFIGESGLAPLQVGGAFPAERLDWTKHDSHTLQVLFAEPRQWEEPLRGTLTLPYRGRSTSCQFVFTPTRTGPFAGRVVVLHRGRVLQTAVLEAKVFDSLSACEISPATERMRFRQEAIVRRSLGTLDDRRWFDASLVLNHTSARQSAMTAVGRKGAYIASLEGIKPQLESINRLLNEVALKPHYTGLSSKKNAELLVNLAREGNWLFRSLVRNYVQESSAADAITCGEYIQIISTQPDALIPLEFVYSYKPPQEGARVCPNAKEALMNGQCPARCVPATNPAPHVCPLGFWGLSKVIERHLHVQRLDQPAAAKILCEPEVGNCVLTLKGPALVAASQQIPIAHNTQLQNGVKSAWRQTVFAVRTWKEWKKRVAAAPPVLIVALPHASGTGASINLEIGGNKLDGIYIDEEYVRPDPNKPAPIALLLGCDTVNVAYTDAYARHVDVFRQADAALVLGTIATVLGVDSAKMAQRLVKHLAKAASARPGRFGEVLRQAKREAVADSLMIALCLVAFGDADWRLES